MEKLELKNLKVIKHSKEDKLKIKRGKTGATACCSDCCYPYQYGLLNVGFINILNIKLFDILKYHLI